MARTLEQIDLELAEVNAAITRVLTGAQGTAAADGSSVQYGALVDLRWLKDQLIKERSAAERQLARRNGGGVFVGDF